MNGVTNGAFWDNETDTTYRKGVTITATPVRIAYLKHVGLVDSVTGTGEEVSAYQSELDRLNGNALAVSVPTYADMLAAATGPLKKDFLVLSDENKGDINTSYTYWPNRCILWNAAVVDVQL